MFTLASHPAERAARCAAPLLALLALAACGPGTNPDGATGDASDVSRPPPGDGGGDGGTCGAGLGPCDPVANTGCMGSQACALGTSPAGDLLTVCTEASGGGYGTPCTMPGQCMAGFQCIGGACTRLCCAPGDDARCQSGAGGVPGATCTGRVSRSSIMVCVAPTRCDWFAQDCPGGANCVPLPGGATTCQPAGAAGEGALCGGMVGMNCARALLCVDTGTGEGRCRRVCNPMLMPMGGDAGVTDAGEADADAPEGGTGTDAGGGGTDPMRCPAGFTCTGITGAPANYGACAPDMMMM